MNPAIVVVLIAAGVHLAPVVVPVLSPDRFIAYMKYLPKLPVMEHGHERTVLPQWYADQFGWEEIVAETAQAWNRLSPEERGDCGIFAQDYGQAGAIDFLGEALRAAAGTQRPSDLLSMGTARILGQLPDCARRSQGNTGKAL